MNITEILSGVPVNAVLRERLLLAQEKHDFEIAKANQRAEMAEVGRKAAEARAIDIEAQLEKSKQEHAITNTSLVEALKKVEWLSGQSKTITKANFGARIPKLKSFK